MNIFELFSAEADHSMPDEPGEGNEPGDAAGAAAAGSEQVGGTPDAAGGEQGNPDEPPAKSEADQVAEIIDHVQTAPENVDAPLPAAGTDEGQGAPGAEGKEGEPAGGAGKEKDEADKGDAGEPDAIEQAAAAEAEKLGIKNEAANAKFKEMYKQVQQIPELEQRAQRGDELFDHIQQTGATGEQMGIALNYIKAVNKDDVQSLTAAYDWLQNELVWLAGKLGKTAPGADVLEGHDDLKALIEQGTPREKVEELAALRNSQRASVTHRESQIKRQEQQDQLTQQQTEAIEQGRTALNALGARLAQEDGEKGKALIEKLVTSDLARIRQLPPAQWASEFELTYLRAKTKEAAAAPAATPRARIGHQPLRPVGGANSGHTKVPTNEMEALELGLQLANSGNYDH